MNRCLLLITSIRYLYCHRNAEKAKSVSVFVHFLTFEQRSSAFPGVLLTDRAKTADCTKPGWDVSGLNKTPMGILTGAARTNVSRIEHAYQVAGADMLPAYRSRWRRPCQTTGGRYVSETDAAGWDCRAAASYNA